MTLACMVIRLFMLILKRVQEVIGLCFKQHIEFLVLTAVNTESDDCDNL